MNVQLSQRAIEQPASAPLPVQEAFIKQINFLARNLGHPSERRWPDGPVCPKCSGKQHSYLSTRNLWKCRGCKKQFSVKAGTTFEDSPLGLDKRLPAVWLITSSRNGVSSMELHRSIGVTQKDGVAHTSPHPSCASDGSFNKASGQVKVDGTSIGQKARNMRQLPYSRGVFISAH